MRKKNYDRRITFLIRDDVEGRILDRLCIQKNKNASRVLRMLLRGADIQEELEAEEGENGDR